MPPLRKKKEKGKGSIADIGCWSFCQDKIMSTAGEGGIVTTNNKKLWEKWSFKDHGKSFNAVTKNRKTRFQMVTTHLN